jgi:dihydropteroate synthase
MADMLTFQQLKDLAVGGAGFILDADSYAYEELRDIVKNAGAPVVIRHARRLPNQQLVTLAEFGIGKVIFDLTD